MKKLLLTGFICLTRGALSPFLLEPVGQEPFHRTGPWRIEFYPPIRVRPDPAPFMGLRIQVPSLFQEITQGGGTVGSHELERDGLLQHRIQTDQFAPVVGQEAFAFLFRLFAHQGLRQRGQGGQEPSTEGVVGNPDHDRALDLIPFFAADPCLAEPKPLIRQRMTGPLSVPLDEREMSFVFRNIAGHAQRGADRIAISNAGLPTLCIGIAAQGHQ